MMNKSLDHVKRATMMKLTTIALLITATLGTLAQAEPRKKEKREHHNYIIERQQAGLVRGTPITRRMIGKREIDIYRDGSMYEKNNYIGNSKR